MKQFLYLYAGGQTFIILKKGSSVVSGMSDRKIHLMRFYMLLDELEKDIGGAKTPDKCTGRMDWPVRGIYFFKEKGEDRDDTGDGPGIVRVGTHALSEGSRTKLWGRLAQHRSIVKTAGGNHRGSIFRLLVGTALMKRHGYPSVL